jgi:prepilin-type N-terminal cleavage/methylation domain-containing protein
MKKGFTLVELMGVIVILCILLLMSVPAINNTVKNQEDREQKDFENSLCMGTKAYMRHHAEDYKDFFNKTTRTADACAKDVYKEGYVSDGLVNPSKNSNLDGSSMKVHVSYNANGIIVCNVQETGC